MTTRLRSYGEKGGDLGYSRFGHFQKTGQSNNTSLLRKNAERKQNRQ